MMVNNRFLLKVASLVLCCLSCHLQGYAQIQPTECAVGMGLRKQVLQAEDLFDAALFSEAIPIYQNVLSTLEKERSSSSLNQELMDKVEAEVRFRLAQAFFRIKDYKSAEALLQNNQTFSEHQFLLATAYNNNGDYDQAIALLQSYLDKNLVKPSCNQLDEATFELAMAFFFKGDLTQAQPIFEKIQRTAPNQRLKILANFYLARIKLSESAINEAENYLNQADQLLTESNLLKYESAFLRGLVYYNKNNFAQASVSFEKAIPPQNPTHVKWYEEALYFLGISYLRLSETPIFSFEKKKEILNKAEQQFGRLAEIAQNERTWMAQGEYYLTLGKQLNDETAFQKAEEIFSDFQKILSQESQNQAVLLRAQAHATYTERDRRFRQITQPSLANKPYYAQAWFLRGINDLEEANSLKGDQKFEEAHKIYERAALSFDKASEYLKGSHPAMSAQAIVLQARSLEALSTEKDRQRAMVCLNRLWEQEIELDQVQSIMQIPDPLEAYILFGHLSAHLSKEALLVGLSKLQQGMLRFANSPSLPQSLNLLGTLFYKLEDFEAAEETFQKTAKEWPQSPLAPEALLFASLSAEILKKDKTVIRSYRQQILDRYPSSPLAAEAYFTLFSYQDYLQADRQAIKHLNAFSELYPDSPLVMNAYFLIGLDNKRDRRSQDGKWLRKKNLSTAIDHFQEVETSFVMLNSKGKINPGEMEHYLLILYRSQLEKGLSNFLLANESMGAKRQIYLEYSQEIFQQLLRDLRSDTNMNKKVINNPEPFWHLEEESAYCLAQSFILSKEYEEAKKVLADMLDKYERAKITRGYFLSRIWSTKGMMASEHQDYEQALACFLQAEDSAKGRVLSTDQRLDLLIHQSRCLKELNQPEKAILILSKVINDDAISNLRIKAMYLRAEIYEKQQRFDLARKQLEATSKKGGEWALKAKEKLEKEYGYH